MHDTKLAHLGWWCCSGVLLWLSLIPLPYLFSTLKEVGCVCDFFRQTERGNKSTRPIFISSNAGRRGAVGRRTGMVHTRTIYSSIDFWLLANFWRLARLQTLHVARLQTHTHSPATIIMVYGLINDFFFSLLRHISFSCFCSRTCHVA